MQMEMQTKFDFRSMRQWMFLAKQEFKYAISEGPSVPFFPKLAKVGNSNVDVFDCESVVSILSLWFVYYVSPLYCITYDTTDFKRMHIILFTIWIWLRCMCIGTTHTQRETLSLTHTFTCSNTWVVHRRPHSDNECYDENHFMIWFR